MKVQMDMLTHFGTKVPSRDIAVAVIGVHDKDFMGTEPGSVESVRETLKTLTNTTASWNDQMLSNGLRKKYPDIYNKLVEIKDKYDFGCGGYGYNLSDIPSDKELAKRTRALDEGVKAIGSDKIDLEFDELDFYA